MSEQRDRVVLAYSGGLDTSVCIKWMQEERGLDVIAVVGDVGQEDDGLEKIHDKALRTGAIECRVVDMREEFAKEYLTPALAANALYEQVPARVRSLAPADCKASRRDRARVRREVRGARLHRQGQ